MGLFSNISPEATIALGILVGLISTCVQSVGLTLQRKSHMLEDEKAEYEVHRPAYKRRRWQVGMLLFLVANIVGSSIQITTLPLPLLSTLQASGLVFNSLLASLLLKEPWTWRTVYGTILVATGAVLISFFSAIPEPSHSLEQLIVLLGHHSFLVWFILSLLLVIALLSMDFTMRKIVSSHKRDSPRFLLVRGMSYGAISGILSAHALLLAKSAVELIVRSVADRNNQFSNYRSWILLMAFLVLALSQLYYLHLGLRLISTSILYPFVFCVYNIVAILDGLIYFRQTSKLPPLHAGLIALGTIVLLAGVLALSWRFRGEGEEDEVHAHMHMSQNEIPQTVLTPGLGFVGDPDSDENSESAIVDEDLPHDLEQGETSPLLTRGSSRRNTSMGSKGAQGRKRKRAATLKEVFDIWDELGDNHEYGTFDVSADATSDDRPLSAEHHRHMRRRRDSAGRSLEAGDIGEQEEGHGSEPHDQPYINAARPRSRGSKGSRRRSTHGGSGALFKDMLKPEWWRRRRKKTIDKGDIAEHEEG